MPVLHRAATSYSALPVYGTVSYTLFFLVQYVN